MYRFVFLVLGMFLLSLVSSADTVDNSHEISSDGDQIHIVAGDFTRTIHVQGRNVYTTNIAIAGKEILAEAANEVSFRIEKASPNRCPVELDPQSAGSVTQKTTMADATDALSIQKEGASASTEEVQWREPRDFDAKTWGEVFDLVNVRHVTPKAGVKKFIIRNRALNDVTLRGVSINIFYEIYDGYPVIRKWVEINNNSVNS